MKKFIVLALAATLALSFASCGGNENETTAAGTDAATEAPAADTAAATEAPAAEETEAPAAEETEAPAAE